MLNRSSSNMKLEVRTTLFKFNKPYISYSIIVHIKFYVACFNFGICLF